MHTTTLIIVLIALTTIAAWAVVALAVVRRADARRTAKERITRPARPALPFTARNAGKPIDPPSGKRYRRAA